MMNAMSNLAESVLGKQAVSTGPIEPLVSDTEVMHAVTWHGKRDMRYEVVPKPIISEPHDVLLRVTATSICGSDLHLWNGDYPTMRKGDIVGHEFMGIIEEKGADVQLPLGSRVVVAFSIICGNCEYCKRQEYSACDTTNSDKMQEKMNGHKTCGLYGYGQLMGGYSGGQADYVRVPFADLNCLSIPDQLPDEKALFLSDIIPTAYHACRDVCPGDTVGIWGMGPIGLCAARWCQILGAKRVIGISGTEYRLDIARNQLGIETINYNNEDALKVLAEMEPRGLDVAIDAAGFRFAKGMMHKMQRAFMLETDTPEIITECATALRKFGRLTVIAAYAGFSNNFPIGMLQLKHLTMKLGMSPTQKLWKYCLDKLMDGTFDPNFVLTHRMSLSDGPKAYEMMSKHEDLFLKCLLRPEVPVEDALRTSVSTNSITEYETLDTPAGAPLLGAKLQMADKRTAGFDEAVQARFNAEQQSREAVREADRITQQLNSINLNKERPLAGEFIGRSAEQTREAAFAVLRQAEQQLEPAVRERDEAIARLNASTQGNAVYHEREERR